MILVLYCAARDVLHEILYISLELHCCIILPTDIYRKNRSLVTLIRKSACISKLYGAGNMALMMPHIPHSLSHVEWMMAAEYKSLFVMLIKQGSFAACTAAQLSLQCQQLPACQASFQRRRVKPLNSQMVISSTMHTNTYA